MTTKVLRMILAIAGLLAGGYGGWLVAGLHRHTLVGLGEWLVAGVVIHDAVLVPLTLVVLLVGARLLPSRARGPVAVGAIVLGTVTLTAVPVLGRFGAHPDNPTLLDRNYVAGWLVFAALVWAAVAVAVLRRRWGEE